MNAPLPSIAPANAAQPAPAHTQDAAAPEVPFSQVLSGEMAQRRASEARAETETRDEASDPSGAGSVVAADGAVPPRGDAQTEAAADLAPPDTAPTLPDAMLALALHPDLLKPAPAVPRAGIDHADAPAQGVDPRSAGKRAANPLQSTADAARASAQASTQTEALALSSQATAPRLPDAAQASERLPDFMNALAAAQAPQVAAALAKPQVNEGLSPSVGTAAWGQALGEKVVWMAAGGQQTASLTLNPPDLGPLQIVVNVSNDQATASFFAAQPEVRQALEAALPRLRDMMQDAGIQLGQATVSAENPHQQEAHDRAPQRAATPFIGNGEANGSELPLAGVQRPQAGRGLVDTFA